MLSRDTLIDLFNGFDYLSRGDSDFLNFLPICVESLFDFGLELTKLNSDFLSAALPTSLAAHYYKKYNEKKQLKGGIEPSTFRLLSECSTTKLFELYIIFSEYSWNIFGGFYNGYKLEWFWEIKRDVWGEGVLEGFEVEGRFLEGFGLDWKWRGFW